VSYVRSKRINGVEFFYLVEGQRVDGKVQQRTLAYLGKHRSVEAAYNFWARERTKPERKVRAVKTMRKLRPYL
jgi:hypothetical protein